VYCKLGPIMRMKIKQYKMLVINRREIERREKVKKKKLYL